MTQELLKQLRDAGFPQPPWKHRYECPHKVIILEKDDAPHECGEEVFVPSLSELIEACGDDIRIELSSTDFATKGKFNFWKTKAFDKGGKYIFTGFDAMPCSDPKTTVALLWLALQNKKK